MQNINSINNNEILKQTQSTITCTINNNSTNNGSSNSKNLEEKEKNLKAEIQNIKEIFKPTTQEIDAMAHEKNEYNKNNENINSSGLIEFFKEKNSEILKSLINIADKYNGILTLFHENNRNSLEIINLYKDILGLLLNKYKPDENSKFNEGDFSKSLNNIGYSNKKFKKYYNEYLRPLEFNIKKYINKFENIENDIKTNPKPKTILINAMIENRLLHYFFDILNKNVLKYENLKKSSVLEKQKNEIKKNILLLIFLMKEENKLTEEEKQTLTEFLKEKNMFNEKEINKFYENCEITKVENLYKNKTLENLFIYKLKTLQENENYDELTKNIFESSEMKLSSNSYTKEKTLIETLKNLINASTNLKEKESLKELENAIKQGYNLNNRKIMDYIDRFKNKNFIIDITDIDTDTLKELDKNYNINLKQISKYINNTFSKFEDEYCLEKAIEKRYEALKQYYILTRIKDKSLIIDEIQRNNIHPENDDDCDEETDKETNLPEKDVICGLARFLQNESFLIEKYQGLITDLKKAPLNNITKKENVENNTNEKKITNEELFNLITEGDPTNLTSTQKQSNNKNNNNKKKNKKKKNKDKNKKQENKTNESLSNEIPKNKENLNLPQKQNNNENKNEENVSKLKNMLNDLFLLKYFEKFKKNIKSKLNENTKEGNKFEEKLTENNKRKFTKKIITKKDNIHVFEDDNKPSLKPTSKYEKEDIKEEDEKIINNLYSNQQNENNFKKQSAISMSFSNIKNNENTYSNKYLSQEEIEQINASEKKGFKKIKKQIKNQHIKNLENKYEDLKTKYDCMKFDYDCMKFDNDYLKNKNEYLENFIFKKNKTISEKNETIRIIRDKTIDAMNQLLINHEEKKDIEKKYENIEKKYENIEKKYENLEKKNENLEKEIEKLKRKKKK